MLRHVLCVLALALCCCTSVCVAAAVVPEQESNGELSSDVEMTVSVAEKVNASNCTVPLNYASHGRQKVEIFTTTVVTEKVDQPTKNGIMSPAWKFEFPRGYNFTLSNSWDVKCWKKDGEGKITEKECHVEGAEDTKRTVDVTFHSTATGYTTEQISTPPEEREINVPAGYSLVFYENVVATCIPLPGTEKFFRPAETVTSGDKDSAVDNAATAQTSSEAESTETDNSFTVNDADHTAPTATPQSETTTEEAPKTDAGISTSAGEGAATNASPALNSISLSGVNLPDHNTDASSRTAWVRAPLLLLLGTLSSVAVW
ncbi:hypothetical protein DQ04_13311010 [Trypanosoma grayi]|uniref:hypothetical protein n=1 Tax=Trypanosoma grayi TaxID=71804 RepID=UPI0004F44E6C|nr:hypothetical protein DQ04_13311010 [Trypanosoma grayi]KEG06568.1 hypothetical protein DQ04_13311010 [Trypanosoma grayi]